jgi:hypothetical protein
VNIDTDAKPYRYVVLVWFFEHWSVNVASDSLEWVEEVVEKASEKHPALLVDTQSGTVRVMGHEPKHVEAFVRDRELPAEPWDGEPWSGDPEGLP